jgi:hypothetical protein
MMDDDEFEAISEIIGKGNGILRDNLPQCHLVHHKPHMTSTGLEHGSSQWESSD